MRYLITSLNNFFLRNNNLNLYQNEFNCFPNEYFNQFINYSNKRRLKLYSSNQYDIYLLRWHPYYECKIHDHPPNGCLFKLLQGELIEKRYDDSLKLINTNNLKLNTSNYIDNSLYYHKIINNRDFLAYSLHIYSPPNFKMKIYTKKID